MSDKKEGKGFFDKVKGFMFEEVEGSNESTKETSELSNANVTPTFDYSSMAGNSAAPTANATGGFDQKMYDELQEIIKASNMEGPDYYEFSNVKKTFDSTMAGVPEAVKVQTAFVGLKANAPTLTKDYLIKAGDYYLGKLDERASLFQTQMQSAIDSKVTSKLNSAKEKEESISVKRKQIEALQAEIAELESGVQKDTAEAQAEQFKIDSTAKNFQFTLEIVRGEIKTNQANINSFVKE